MKRLLIAALAVVISAGIVFGLAGCAGCSRDLSSFGASNFGSDWIIVQYRFDGQPINCWKLKDAAITNEAQSDGIFWKDPATGHLVHISGWYNRVQVTNDDFTSAAKLIGVETDACGEGKYPTEKAPDTYPK